MKRFAFICLAALFLLGMDTLNSASPRVPHQATVKAQDSVYICYSHTSYAYHSSPGCSGLDHCTCIEKTFTS